MSYPASTTDTDPAATHPADSHDLIRVVGARVNNLKDVTLEIPKRRLTVFTGVSGSGKSSLVFDTIAAESQRMINETYSAFVQGFMPRLDRPEVDALHGLTTAIVVGQERLAANIRSTLGTVSDVNASLRILFSRFATPHVGSPQAFSFNVPSASGSGALTVQRGERTQAQRATFEIVGGMCPTCEGTGQVKDIDLDQVVDTSRSIADGAILVPGYTPDGWYAKIYTAVVPGDKPVKDFTKKQRHDLLYADQRKIKVETTNITYEGLVPRITKSMLSKDRDALQSHVRDFVDRAVTFGTCPDCGGTRLAEGARNARIDGVSIADACAMQISDLAGWVTGLDLPGAAPLLAGLGEMLAAFVEIGLGYLSLDRSAGTLSGGEAQRTKLVRHLGSALTDVTYVFDEPTIGLHPHDVERMNDLLGRLRDKGNTVLVVEHKPETIAVADHVVDMGPGAGSGGGEVVFEGSVADLRSSGTLTGRHLDDRARLKEAVRTPSGHLEIRGAGLHNLKDVDVDVPLGLLVAVTGVAGSGKSSLVHGSLAGRDGVVLIDQTPIKGSRRSNPATYTGALEPLRKAFAKANGVKPALFSANSEGACPACNGAGLIFTELGFMDTVTTTCEECGGRRYRTEVLAHTLGGHSIADVLEMPVVDALALVEDPGSPVPAAAKILRRIVDVGLGYLTLGQPLSTLSGGERQRLKLATRMGDPGEIYILDEPTTGLHLADVEQMLAMLDGLVDAGRSVIVIEHHQAVMAHADWIIDLGPGAGHDGGQVVFEGTPAELVAARTTLTGEHLADYVAG